MLMFLVLRLGSNIMTLLCLKHTCTLTKESIIKFGPSNDQWIILPKAICLLSPTARRTCFHPLCILRGSHSDADIRWASSNQLCSTFSWMGLDEEGFWYNEQFDQKFNMLRNILIRFRSFEEKFDASFMSVHKYKSSSKQLVSLA